jgi:uncharacterized protein (TIGR02757 family)
MRLIKFNMYANFFISLQRIVEFLLVLRTMTDAQIKKILNANYEKFNRPNFIQDDPISIPHAYSKKEDIEIIGFLIAIIAWGQRKSILKSGEKLREIFDDSPHEFILGHTDSDLKSCETFVHRTFNSTDLLSIIGFLKELYSNHSGLEYAFSKHILKKDTTVENGLNGFRTLYENSESYIKRTAKHIAYPAAGSACKRLNMYLRWMVRNDDKGVDFGIWKSISPSQLICPLDVHVLQQAAGLHLIDKEKSDWKTALQLTAELRKFDKTDPVKYDFALFGLGIEKKTVKNLSSKISV